MAESGMTPDSIPKAMTPYDAHNVVVVFIFDEGLSSNH